MKFISIMLIEISIISAQMREIFDGCYNCLVVEPQVCYNRMNSRKRGVIMTEEKRKDAEAKTKAMDRLYNLLSLQKQVEEEFGEDKYNVFVFGSYLTLSYQEGKSDIDIAIYSENFQTYKRLSAYLEEYFRIRGIESDIFYIDTTMEAPIYCAPLNSKVQFTDYFPQKLIEFSKKCQLKLNESKARMAV